MLGIVCLTLGATLVPEIRKPFDILAEGHSVLSSRGDKTAIELFVSGLTGWEAGLRSYFSAKSDNFGNRSGFRPNWPDF